MLEDRRGQWWFATREGLYRFGRVDRFEHLSERSRKRFIGRVTGSSTTTSPACSKTREGTSGWPRGFRQREVLVRWDRATESFHRYGEKDGLRPFITGLAFAEDASGNVWAGFREGGLARYRNGRFTMVGPNDGVGTGSVNGIYVDQAGRVWVAVSGRGVCRIDDPCGRSAAHARDTRRRRG